MPGNLTDFLALGLGGLMLLVGLVAVGSLAVGTFQARSLVQREAVSYFLSPVAYVVLVVFLAATGALFYLALDALTATGPVGTDWPMRTMFGNVFYGNLVFWPLFLVVPPILTMRLFAEEQSSGRLEVLMTAPVTDWQVVLGKYLGCLAFYAVLLLPTLLYLPALTGAQTPVVKPAFTAWGLTMLAGLVAAELGLNAMVLPVTAGWRAAVVLPKVALGVALGAFLAYLGYLAVFAPDVDLGVFADLRPYGWALLVAGAVLAVALVALGIVGVWLVPGTGTRLAGTLLFAAGVTAALVGGINHYNRDAEHLLEIPVVLDPYPVLTTYLGLVLAGAMFLAVGVLVSSLVRDQIVAAVLAIGVGLVFIVPGLFRPEPDGSLFYQAVYFVSVPLHFDYAFTRGLIDSRPLVLYASVTGLCLFLTVRSLESRRWQ